MMTEKELVEAINRTTRKSKLYKQMISKRYPKVRGYTNHSVAVFNLARSFTCYQDYPIGTFEKDFTHRIALEILSTFDSWDFKRLWLSSNLYEAINVTDLPKSILSFKRPVKTGLLFIPPVIINPDGQVVRWIAFYHRYGYESTPDVTLNQGTIGFKVSELDTISWFTILDNQIQYASNKELQIKDNSLTLNDYDNLHLLNPSDNEVEEKDFANQITNLLLKTILYLQTKEEELKVLNESSRTIGFGDNSKLQPYIVGRTYKSPISHSQSLSNTTSRKSTHWRRGYYRHQPYGKRDNPQHYLRWIEPVLVNS